MGKKVMVSFLAALMIASSFSTTAFAALGKTDTVAKTQQEQQETKKKVVKKKTASSKTTTDEKETDWKEEMLTLVKDVYKRQRQNHPFQSKDPDSGRSNLQR